MDVLLLLAANAGQIISNNALFEGAWRDVAVTPNSVAQAIAGLRKTLDTQPDGAPYIETVTRRGYRFLAPVERSDPSTSNAALVALLDPHRAFIDGRAAMETLDLRAVARARQAFEDALRAAPGVPATHIGMASACALTFESTRVDAAPDVAALQRADRHAREACRLDPSSGEAWSTLAFVLHRNGDGREAIAAAREAVRLEPDVWRHYLRLASVSWGDERLRAAHRVRKLCPGLALAYWFTATVFVARQAFDAALEALRTGCSAQDGQCKETGRFHMVGLHLLHGLVLAAQGAIDDALEELARELSKADDNHVYARECCATACYAIGALRFRQGRRDESAAAFYEALTRVPGYAPAAAALAILAPSSLKPGLGTRDSGFGGDSGFGRDSGIPRPHDANTVEAAVVNAVLLTLQGLHDEAARLCGDALARANPGSAGWLLPVDPLLHVTAHHEAWAQTLAILRERAA
jgi:tetratricopeptide (TPR) repeat protein